MGEERGDEAPCPRPQQHVFSDRACCSLRFYRCSVTGFSSVSQSCLTLCNLMDYSTSGFPVHHQFLELAQTHVHSVSDIQPFDPVSSVPFSCLQSFPASGSFPMSPFFSSGGQSVGVPASALVLPMNIGTDFL